MSALQDKFKFYVPGVDIVEKSLQDSTNQSADWEIEGIASTNDLDSDGEMLDVNGMDLSEFKWINWNHKGKDNSGAIIGERIEARVIDGRQLYFKGCLFQDMPMAQTTFLLMKSLRKSKVGNKLCLSVEGKVTERDPNNPAKILKSKITAVAVCPTPINGSTWTDLVSKGCTEEMVFDEDAEKAFDIETNQHVTKPSIEGAENEEDKDKKNKKNNRNTIKYLSKASAYSILSDYLYQRNKEQPSTQLLKSTYQFVQKMSDSKISQEAIDLALKNLNVISKGADGEETLTQATDLYKSYMEIKEDATPEMAAQYLISKGIVENIANSVAKVDGAELTVKNGSIESLIKSMTDEFGQKADALGTLIKSQIEVISLQSETIGEMRTILDEQQEVMKSQTDFIGEMRKRIEVVENTSRGAKSIVKGFGERFDNNGEDLNKGKDTYSLSDNKSRKALIAKISEISNLNKGVDIDMSLAQIGQEIEIAKSVSEKSLQRLNALNINVVK